MEDMESIIRNVNQIEPNERQIYEAVLGRHLSEDEKIVIRVLPPGAESDDTRRQVALERASEIARLGRANAAAQGVSEKEIDVALAEALAHVRSRPIK